MRVSIVLRSPQGRGHREVSTYDHDKNEEIRTGIVTYSESETDRVVNQLKGQIEQTGAYVSVKEM